MSLKKKKTEFDKKGMVVSGNVIPKKLIKKCLIDLKNYKIGNLEKKNKHIVIDNYKKKNYIRYFRI